MPSRSHSFSSDLQEPDKLQELAKDSIDREQKLHALETELDGLQTLVCYLLEKNERLRMEVQALGELL